MRQASVMNQLKCYGVVCTTRVGWRGKEVGRSVRKASHACCDVSFSCVASRSLATDTVLSARKGRGGRVRGVRGESGHRFEIYFFDLGFLWD